MIFFTSQPSPTSRTTSRITRNRQADLENMGQPLVDLKNRCQ